MTQLNQITEPSVLASDNNIFVDVDETLVFWRIDEDPNDIIIQVNHPYLHKYIELIPHHRNIDLVKSNKGQGRRVIIWSAGGYAWAEAVVKALKLESYVDLIMAKPIAYVDDLPMENWGCQRVYLNKNLPHHPISKKE